MRLILLALCFSVFFGFAAAKQATICEGDTEWVEEIGGCAIVEYDKSDVDLAEMQAKAEGIWAKFQSWYEGIAEWKEACFSPSETPVSVDPSKPKGVLKSFEGEVFVQRGIDIIVARAGMELQPGDVVKVSEGAQATLDLRDTGVLTVNQSTNFSIPNTDKASSGIWGKAKGLVDGVRARASKCFMKNRLKNPESVGGVRG